MSKSLDGVPASPSDRAEVRRTRLRTGLPPYRRERLRREYEARFLRRVGTPEDLIGPVASDEDVDAEAAGLIEFARRLRARAQQPES